MGLEQNKDPIVPHQWNVVLSTALPMFPYGYDFYWNFTSNGLLNVKSVDNLVVNLLKTKTRKITGKIPHHQAMPLHLRVH